MDCSLSRADKCRLVNNDTKKQTLLVKKMSDTGMVLFSPLPEARCLIIAVPLL